MILALSGPSLSARVPQFASRPHQLSHPLGALDRTGMCVQDKSSKSRGYG